MNTLAALVMVCAGIIAVNRFGDAPINGTKCHK